MDIKFGLKLWSVNKNSIDAGIELVKENVFQYIELLYVPGTEIKPFLGQDIPYIIHIPHQSFGLNIGDKTKKEFNLKNINTCINWADRLNATYLILHAGYGSVDAAKDLLKEVRDDRIVIENMPKIGINEENKIGYELNQLKELIDIKAGGFGFCLDFGHAAKAAVSMNKDYKKYIKELLTLNPDMFHICDFTLKNGLDEHLNIGEGEVDFNFLKECILSTKSRYVTLETQRKNLNSLNGDLTNLGKIRENWKDTQNIIRPQNNASIINIIIDKDSWMNAHTKKLGLWLKENEYQLNIVNDYKEIKPADISIFISYTKIVPRRYLNISKSNIVIHESDLPLGKGMSPLTWQILEDKNEIPIVLFECTEECDAGDIYLKEVMNFRGDELVDELRRIQANKTILLIKEYITKFGSIKGKKQKGISTIYPRRTKEDSRIDIDKTIKEQFNLLRVVDNEKYPAFFDYMGNRYILKIFKNVKKNE